MGVQYAIEPGISVHAVIIDATAVAPQPWQNGGGQTRELLAWPADGDWKLRISRADIESDGPFSQFPQVQRWLAILQGAGVVLMFAGVERTLRKGDEPLCFNGGQAPGCRLLGGPTQDLNLMVRDGTAVMRKALNQQRWEEPFTMRGLYTTVPGCWRHEHDELTLTAHTLLWADTADGGAWSFAPSNPFVTQGAWWLGYTPGD